MPKPHVDISSNKTHQVSRPNKTVALQQQPVIVDNLQQSNTQVPGRTTRKELTYVSQGFERRDGMQVESGSLSHPSLSSPGMDDEDVRFRKPPDENAHNTMVPETQLMDDTRGVANAQDNMVLESSSPSFVYESHFMEQKSCGLG